MESTHSNLLEGLFKHFPNKIDQLQQLYNDLQQTIEGYTSVQGIEGGGVGQASGSGPSTLKTDQNTSRIPDMSGEEQPSRKFQHFGQFLEAVKNLVSIDGFRSFVDTWVHKQPENNRLLKEEIKALEKAVIRIEGEEAEKFKSAGLSIPLQFSGSTTQQPTAGKAFSHSSLQKDMREEFKDAKWVVLTNPLIKQRSSKGQGKESSVSLSASANNSNQLLNIGQNSNSLQRTQSAAQAQAQLQAQAKIAAQAPQKRYGHSACLVKNKMYIFGGLASRTNGGNLQTLFECTLKFGTPMDEGTSGLNGLLYSWDKIKVENPRARDSHTFIHVGDSMIMFGGSGGQCSFNDLYKFDMRNQKWHKLEPFGDLPAPREGHIAKLLGSDKMVVHGGVDQSETSFSDTYVLSGISQYIDQSQLSSIYAAYIPQSELKLSTPQQNSMLRLEDSLMVDNGLDSSNPNQYIDTATPQAQDSFLCQSNTITRSAANILQKTNGPVRLRWHKCIDRGQVPSGRDSHSSAMINNKIYIFGGQGDGDMIFDDLYSVEVIEEPDPMGASGEVLFVSNWEMIEPQTPKGEKAPYPKPRARTSHTCTVYKNRYMIIVGGEGEFDEEELKVMNASDKNKKKEGAQKKKGKTGGDDDEICLDLDNENTQENNEKKNSDGSQGEEDGEDSQSNNNKRPLNDVWVYDTLYKQWHEISAPFKIQGSLLGKKIKKEFEPRLAHTAVQFNQFVVIFGGLGQDSLVSNDLYVLSLDGNLGAITSSIDTEPPISIMQNQAASSTIRIQQSTSSIIEIPTQNHQMERQSSIVSIPNTMSTQGFSNNSTIQIPTKGNKTSKGLKITNPDDRKVMSGQIVNQIINYNNPLISYCPGNGNTNQFFISGGHFSNTYLGGAQQNHLPPQAQSELIQNIPTPVQKNDCEVQTQHDDDVEHSSVSVSNLDPRAQLLMIMKQNDFRLSSFQRTKYSFIKSLAEQITWPLQCFGSFIDNSIEAFDGAKTRAEAQKTSPQQMGMNLSNLNQRFSLPLDIEINLKNTQSMTIAQSGEEQYSTSRYLEIKDNGAGMHPKLFMEVLTSFGHNQAKTKSNYCFSEHGVGLKLACLRLASTSLVITKTKPTFDCGTSSFYISFGLLSSDFLKKADSMNGYLVAPIVSLEIRNKRISKHLTPEPDHFLNMLVSFTKNVFDSSDRLLQYALNVMPEQGGTHIFLFNLIKQRASKKDPDMSEIGISQDKQVTDITLNPQIFGYSSGIIESSLTKYLQYLYVEYPPWVRIFLNGKQIENSNPYSQIKLKCPSAFLGERQDKFAVQLVLNDQLKENLNQAKIESDGLREKISNSYKNADQNANLEVGEEDIEKLKQIDEWVSSVEKSYQECEGVLIYRGNKLIRRLENVFADEDDAFGLGSRGENSKQQRMNAIVSVFKSKSQLNITQTDFTEKQIIKKVREWFKQYHCQKSKQNPELTPHFDGKEQQNLI